MPKQIPVPSPANQAFWDAANERRLVVQQCQACSRLIYPPKNACDQCGATDQLGWKEVEGKGHVKEFFVVEDTRIRRMMEDQPFNMALITLDEDPGLIFLSNLPGTPAGEVEIGEPVELVWEEIVPVPDMDPAVTPGQLIPEWKIVK